MPIKHDFIENPEHVCPITQGLMIGEDEPVWLDYPGAPHQKAYSKTAILAQLNLKSIDPLTGTAVPEKITLVSDQGLKQTIKSDILRQGCCSLTDFWQMIRAGDVVGLQTHYFPEDYLAQRIDTDTGLFTLYEFLTNKQEHTTLALLISYGYDLGEEDVILMIYPEDFLVTCVKHKALPLAYEDSEGDDLFSIAIKQNYHELLTALKARLNGSFFNFDDDIADSVYRLFKKDFPLFKAWTKTFKDINAPDSDGNTLMHWAAVKSNFTWMQWLLDQGASFFINNNREIKPINLLTYADAGVAYDAMIQHCFNQGSLFNQLEHRDDLLAITRLLSDPKLQKILCHLVDVYQAYADLNSHFNDWFKDHDTHHRLRQPTLNFMEQLTLSNEPVTLQALVEIYKNDTHAAKMHHLGRHNQKDALMATLLIAFALGATCLVTGFLWLYTVALDKDISVMDAIDAVNPVIRERVLTYGTLGILGFSLMPQLVRLWNTVQDWREFAALPNQVVQTAESYIDSLPHYRTQRIAPSNRVEEVIDLESQPLLGSERARPAP